MLGGAPLASAPLAGRRLAAGGGVDPGILDMEFTMTVQVGVDGQSQTIETSTFSMPVSLSASWTSLDVSAPEQAAPRDRMVRGKELRSMRR